MFLQGTKNGKSVKDALLAPLGSTYSEPSKDLEELEEVHLITSVLCLIAAHDFSSVKGDGDVGLPDSSVRGFQVRIEILKPSVNGRKYSFSKSKF